MDDPEAKIWLGPVWIAGLSGNEPESTTRVEGLWLAGEESRFLEVDF